MVRDMIYLGNPSDKNSGLDWPGVLRLSCSPLYIRKHPWKGRVGIICSEIESALSACFSFEKLSQRNEKPKGKRVGFLHSVEPSRVETTWGMRFDRN